MTRVNRLAAGLAVAVLVGCASAPATAQTGGATPAAAAEPWREPQDTFAAVFESDRYAWRLFVAMNWPANLLQKEADPAKALGAAGPVVWESWRNVRPDAPDTIFRSDGRDPGPWLSGAAPVVAREEQKLDRRPLKLQTFLAARNRPGQPGLAFDSAVGAGNEVRLNLGAYEFIRTNQLFNVEGQIAQISAGRENLNFPPSAKEVKAQWRRIRETDKPRYHWAEVTGRGGQREVWGVTALHISTKDVPNWFWTTFEHIDNKTPGPIEGGGTNVGWLVRSVDKFACPAPPHDCEKAPAGIGLEGTVWANYRLRGTQLDFVDSIGRPTILANSQIEAPFQAQSSCVTCHALATLNRQGDDAGFSIVSGTPRPEWYLDPATQQRTFMQLDFVWSLRRAARRGGS